MADAEARQELRRLLDSAVGALLMEGRSWDEVVAEVRRRLVGGEAEVGPAGPRSPSGMWVNDAPVDMAGVVEGSSMSLQDGVWRVHPDVDPATGERLKEAGRPPGVSLADPGDLVVGPGGYSVADADGRWDPSAVLPREAGRPALAPVTALPVDEPGEPPVGTVVTDTRMRVCWRDEAGWHRSGVEAALSWADVCQAVGGPEQQPMPGQPTIVSQPPQRAQGPTVVRPAGALELLVQRAVLGDDGQPLLGPNGQPMLKTVTETMEISEVVPAGRRP